MAGGFAFRLFLGGLVLIFLVAGSVGFYADIYQPRRLFWVVVLAMAVAGGMSGLFAVAIGKKMRGLRLRLDGMSEKFFGKPLAPIPGGDIETVFSHLHLFEERIADAMRALEEEKRNIKTTIESLNDGVLLLGHDGHIALCNSAFGRILGFPEGHRYDGIPFGEVVRIPKILNAYDQVTATGRMVNKELELGAGPVRNMSFMIYPLPAEREEEQRILLILRDMTEQKRVEQMRVDFVANVSHELKTPLTAIMGFVETLEDGAMHEPETARRFLGIIKKNSGRLKLLTDDLLALSDIEAGNARLHYEKIDPDRLLQGVRQTFTPTAKKKKVTLEYAVESGTERFDSDREKLLQVLQNLVDNALKYTPSGGTVRMTCRRLCIDRESKSTLNYAPLDATPLLPETDDDWRRCFIEFTVTDTGDGIPPQHIPRLMERFYRVDKARSRDLGGTGLGLSIIKHTLIALGGSIRIVSEQGKGTTAHFIVPTVGGVFAA